MKYLALSVTVTISTAICSVAMAGDLARASTFESVEGFVAALKALEPASSTSDCARLFVIREPLEPEKPPVAAHAVATAEDEWSGSRHALIFATATPPTGSTRSVIGVLFLLVRTHAGWHIADLLRCVASGKYAGVSCELAAGAGTGYELGAEGMRPIVTITEDQGGRGYGYKLSASYSFAGNKLKRVDLE